MQPSVLDPAKPVPDALRGAVLALGNFDGVHRGHAELARVAVAMAAERGGKAAALTFEPHPRSVFRPEQPVFRLTPPQVKTELLGQAGLPLTFVLPFDRDIAAIEAEAFVDDLLLGKLGATGLVCGYDFHFGRGRAGSPETLQARAQAAGIPVAVVPPFSWSGEAVSSTLIRTALEQGDVARAAEFLGRPWFVRGVVAHGDKRGRDLGYPTANMNLARDCKLRYGIYAVRMRIDGVWHDGVASFGSRPHLRRWRAAARNLRLQFLGRSLRQTGRCRAHRLAARRGKVRQPRGPDRPDGCRQRQSARHPARDAALPSVSPAC